MDAESMCRQKNANQISCTSLVSKLGWQADQRQVFSLSVLLVGEPSGSQSLSYSRMISVADGDLPPPFLLDPSGSVSVPRSTSGSGFVTVIRFVSSTTVRGSMEENEERVVDGRLVRVTVVGSTLVAGGSSVGPERTEDEEGDIGGEMKMVFRRAIRVGIGGGFGTGIGGK